LFTHSTQTPEKQEGVALPAHCASLVHIGPHVWKGEQAWPAMQSAEERQSTQTCMLVSQTCPWQSALVAHCTQTPALQTPIGQSALVMQAFVHVFEVVSHLGVGPMQSASARQSTHWPVLVLQTCI
jgi:hypothetical protein